MQIQCIERFMNTGWTLYDPYINAPECFERETDRKLQRKEENVHLFYLNIKMLDYALSSARLLLLFITESRLCRFVRCGSCFSIWFMADAEIFQSSQ